LAPRTKDEFAEEVENRAPAEAFEETQAGDDAWEEPPSEQIQDPLRKLKTIVLSIDWEINTEVMTGFVEQVAVLQDHYREDKIVLVFLQLLGSLGEYIRVNLGKSHPEAFRVLNSLFNQLEKVAQSGQFSEPEKKKMLSAELARYKKLKSQLAPTAVKPAATPPTVEPKTAEPLRAVEDAPPLNELIADLKSSLMSEIQALRKEVLMIKKALAKAKSGR